MVLAAGVGRAWYYFFRLEERTGQRSVQKEGERRGKKWCGSRRDGNREEKKIGNPGGMAKGQQANLSECVRRPSKKERKETERPVPSGLAAPSRCLTTEELILWARLGTAGTGGDDHAGPLRDQTQTQTRHGPTAGLDSPALNE